jgi:hypothetical protein
MMKGVQDMQSVGMPPSRGAGAATATTASSSLTEGEFTHDVHPFRFASATGLTPKLVTAKASGETCPRERLPLGMFSKNAALSSFGGKFGESKHWLTPRGEIGGGTPVFYTNIRVRLFVHSAKQKEFYHMSKKPDAAVCELRTVLLRPLSALG